MYFVVRARRVSASSHLRTLADQRNRGAEWRRKHPLPASQAFTSSAPDVAVLERHFATRRNHYHAVRYHHQEQGVSTFLIAFLDDIPAGSGEVMWRGAKEPDVRERFPGCLEINGLAVAPDRQSQGIGSMIIRAAEQLAVRRGHHRIGMGVDEQNVRAAALYRRLGYQDTGYRYLDRYQYIDDRGVRNEVTDSLPISRQDVARDSLLTGKGHAKRAVSIRPARQISS